MWDAAIAESGLTAVSQHRPSMSLVPGLSLLDIEFIISIILVKLVSWLMALFVPLPKDAFSLKFFFLYHLHTF